MSCLCHVPKDERSKLDASTKECIYLGTPQDEFGYRLWDPANKKIVRSRDVLFFEEQTIEDIKKGDKPMVRKHVSLDTSPLKIKE